MASRINIGPDGGPYIAINENSGDIELEDNSGVVVAKYDDANAQWDFLDNPLTGVAKGTATDLGVEFTGGAGFYVDTNGEIVAVDEAGNETIIT